MPRRSTSYHTAPYPTSPNIEQASRMFSSFHLNQTMTYRPVYKIIKQIIQHYRQDTYFHTSYP